MIPRHIEKLKKDFEITGLDNNNDFVQLSREGFNILLQGYITAECKSFDASWYLEHYPDIGESILNKKCRSARDHYTKFGYLEGRLPGFKNIDLNEYVKRYPDLLKSLAAMKPLQRVKAAKKHFIEHGYKEGRKI
jgi:hypothetical protein